MLAAGEKHWSDYCTHTKWDVCRDFSNLVTVWKRYIYTSQRSSVRTWKKLPQAEGNLKH